MAENENLFRRVNERVEDQATADEDRVEFVCECADVDCHERVLLTLGVLISVVPALALMHHVAAARHVVFPLMPRALESLQGSWSPPSAEHSPETVDSAELLLESDQHRLISLSVPQINP